MKNLQAPTLTQAKKIIPYHQIPTLVLSEEEVDRMDRVGEMCINLFSSIDNPKFIKISRQLAFKHLPGRIISEVTELYYREVGFSPGKEALLIKNLCTIGEIGDTPESWKEKTNQQIKATRKYEFLIMLMESLFWNVVSFKEQRGGNRCHDIIPQYGDEHEQIGTSSRTELSLHTEDVPLENSADMMGLLTLRNIEKAESTICFVQNLELPKQTWDNLFKNWYIFPPDPNLLKDGISYDMRKKPILYGNKDKPSIRIAPVDIFENDINISHEALESVIALDNEIKKRANRFIMEAGDFLMFSNRRCLHGRGSFNPIYLSGKKRWVLRMMAVEGMLRSSAHRTRKDPWLITERSIQQDSKLVQI